jgi:hypothetical protein
MQIETSIKQNKNPIVILPILITEVDKVVSRVNKKELTKTKGKKKKHYVKDSKGCYII